MNGNGSRAISKEVRIDSKRRVFAEFEGGGSPTARMVHELERRIGFPIKCKAGEWFMYDGTRWKVHEDGSDSFRSIAWNTIELSNRNHRRTTEILNALEDMRSMKPGEKFFGAIRYFDEDTYLLNLANGVLQIDRETGKVVGHKKHKPEDMFTASLGRYDDIPCNFFKRILREVLPLRNDRKLLLDFATSALLPDSRHECALFCVGTGANGKSVITEALSNAIGEEVCSALSLHQICGNERKHIHRLPYKLLNVATETDTSTISNTSVFKNVVSGEVFETEILYQKAGFKTQTNVKLCFLMNNLPRLKHGTEGDLRRIRVLHFSNRFSGEDRDSMLRQKLRAERGGILAYLIRRLPRVCLLEELPYGSFESQKMLSTFAGNTDIILTFFAQCAEIAPYGNSKRDPRRKIISKQNLYNVFCRFCRRNDQGVRLGNSQFFKIARQLYPQLDWDHNIDHGKLGRGACVRGLRFSEYGYELFYGDET